MKDCEEEVVLEASGAQRAGDAKRPRGRYFPETRPCREGDAYLCPDKGLRTGRLVKSGERTKYDGTTPRLESSTTTRGG